MQDYRGKQIDHYLILDHVGLGGMALVYKAYDLRLERDVAVKMIRTDEIPPSQLERLMKRFEREAKAQSSFSHPNIVPVFDYGKFEGIPYLVLKYLPGGTLKERMKGPSPLEETLRVMIPISDAVAYAHFKSVLHRDIKPSNIIFNEEDQPLLADFGIAKVLEGNEGTLTGTGLGVGTPEYMAPEQWQGKATEASDQYALGVLLYELLTGNKPFTAETPLAVALKQINEPLKRPTDLVPEIPLPIEGLIFKTMAREPQDRFASVSQLRDRLILLAVEYAPQSEEPEVIEEQLPPEPLEIDPTPATPMPVSDTDQLTLTGYQLEEIQAEAVEVVQESEEDVNPPIKFESDSATTPEEESEPPTPKDMTPKIPEPATSQPKPRKKSSHKRKPVVQPRFLWLAVSLVVLAGLTWGGITLLLKSDFLNNTNAQSESANPDVTSTVTPEIPATEAVSATPTYTATATATVTPKPTYTIITRTRELDGMVQVYIPAGEVQLGLSEEQTTQFEEMCQAYEASLNEDDKLYCSFIQNSAQNTVAAVEGFWIDQTEVTNSMYEICRLSGACPPVIKFSFTRQVYYRDSQYANYPMMFTYWDEANAYCQWVGGRLPTHAEWRMAAVGTDGRIFPWGDSPPSSSLLNFYGNEIGDTITVGSYPEGVSPYGVYDLLGNVSEWLDDCFISEGGPQGTNGEYCGYAGGSAIERMFIYLVYPGFDNPGGSIGQGFRCVMDDDLEN